MAQKLIGRHEVSAEKQQYELHARIREKYDHFTFILNRLATGTRHKRNLVRVIF